MNPKALVSLLALALASPLLVAGCGSGVDTGKAEKEIKNGIASKTGSDVKYVKCPDSVNAKKGAEFHCDALIPVTVKQVDENGNIRWQVASLSGPPLTAGATGSSGPTGATAPNAKAPSAPASPSAGGGAANSLAAEARLVRYRNGQQGYTILHPALWQQTGAPSDVSFNGPASRFVHLVTVKAPVLTPAQVHKQAQADPRFTKIGQARRTRFGNSPAVVVQFVFKAPTGRQVLQRYVTWRGGKQLTAEIGSTERGDTLPRFRAIRARIVQSFRWL